MQKLLRAGMHGTDILIAVASHRQRFKALLDSAGPDGMDQLARKFSGFHRYAIILEALAAGKR